jgi:hypothetical protein
MLTFPNVTPEVFALVLDQLRTEARVSLGTASTPTGSGIQMWHVEGNGVKARVLHGGGDTVQVEIDKKPFYVSEGMIGGKIRDAITLAQQAIAKAGQGGPERAA